MSKAPKDSQEIAVEGDRVVVATIDAACVSAFYATSEGERCDIGTTFLWTVSAFAALEKLWECDTKEQASGLVGEAILWCLFMHFVHVSEGDRAVRCPWFKSHEWSARPADTDLDGMREATRELRSKMSRLVPVAARFCATSPKAKELVASTSLMPLVASMVNDRDLPGTDLKAICGWLKTSPRECFERAVFNRKDTLEQTYKRFKRKDREQ